MSTQEIGALIDSVNNMTATVAGKMGEIDNKVDESIAQFEAAFPAEFAKYTNRIVYVDAVSGVDEPESSTYKTMDYALKDNASVQALEVRLKTDILYDGYYLVTNRYLSINLMGKVLRRTFFNYMFNGEFNTYVKIFNGELNFDIAQPEQVAPSSGRAPFFYTIDTVMTLILGDRDGWSGNEYKGGLTVKSNCANLIAAIGSHINYRTHSCRFELTGEAASCNVLYLAYGASVEQYASYNVVADAGFTWEYTS